MRSTPVVVRSPETPTLVLDPVLREEADFANEDYAVFADDLCINEGMFARYASPSALWDWRQMSALLLGDLAGKDLLDYGCGMGEESIYFAKLGARVTGIDISEVGITSLKRRAEYHHVDVAAHQMRVDTTEFADASFDRIHGLGILHHVGIHAGLAEVRRLLKPGGIAVFLEPLGDSPTVEAVKTWLMRHARFLGNFDHVTDHERNLTWLEIEDATREFATCATFPYHLLYRLKRLLPASQLARARKIDHGLLALFPALARFAGGVVIRVTKAR